MSKSNGILFENKYLERLTKTPASLPISSFFLLSILLVILSLSYYAYPIVSVPLVFMGGLLSFTLIEYLMHRFLFHLSPKNEKQEAFSYKIHGVHHDFPKDKDRLAMPIPLSLLLSFLFFLLFQFIMGNNAYAFHAGFIAGYAAYLGVHYLVHAKQPPQNIFKVLWINHGIHHYKDDHVAFGVSSPFWDYVFGTLPPKKKK